MRGPGQFVTAGNASQLSDGASACVVMDSGLAARRGLRPLGIFRGFAVAGCEPDEMGIGPVFAVPRLLERCGVRLADVDLFELNEAFAVQVVYCRDRLGIPMERLNVDGVRNQAGGEQCLNVSVDGALLSDRKQHFHLLRVRVVAGFLYRREVHNDLGR